MTVDLCASINDFSDEDASDINDDDDDDDIRGDTKILKPPMLMDWTDDMLYNF